MTSEEKVFISNFLNLTSDYLKDGHRREPFENDEMPGNGENAASGLPLAYSIEEPEHEESYSTTDSSDSFASNDSLSEVAAEICACGACALAATRKHAVPGEGSDKPLVMVIGEGPGADEDATGRPFVGRAGQLLDKMLTSIGLSRNENCFIANMVKCRPPGNRDPGPEEMAACFPYLERQIRLLKPQIILCAGRIAAQNLLKTSKAINDLHGKFAEINVGELAIPVLPTFHPSGILRDESKKRPAWEDLKLLRSRITFPDSK